MCLAVPARIVSATHESGIADLSGLRVSVSTVLVPDVVEGDWVLVHAGFAIQRLTAEEAAEVFDAVGQAAAAGRGAGHQGGSR